jgi:hypothetical protein
MLRVILGLLKGGAIGAAVGGLALQVGVAGGFFAAVTYAIVGGLVGILCGRPPWRQDTFWTSTLKGIFGVAVGVGLYFLGRKLLGGAHLAVLTQLGAPDRPLGELPIVLGPVIGAIWGIFVEVDDGGSADAAKANANTNIKKADPAAKK